MSFWKEAQEILSKKCDVGRSLEIVMAVKLGVGLCDE